MPRARARCFTASGFGVWTACIERASDSCYVISSGSVEGECFREDPCERVGGHFRDIDENRALLEKDLIVVVDNGCLHAHAGSILCKERIEAFHARVVVEEGSTISEGQTIAFTLSRKSTVRHVKAGAGGLVLLVHWNPQASIDEYTVYIDCMKQVRRYERREERGTRDI